MKCSKSKTIWIRKLNISHHVDLISSTWCELFSFLGLIFLDLKHFKVLGGLVFFFFTLYISIMHLCQLHTLVVRKVLHAKVCSPETFQLFCLWEILLLPAHKIIEVMWFPEYYWSKYILFFILELGKRSNVISWQECLWQ